MRHRKTVRHFEEPGHLHELTFSCYQRMPLLTNDDWRVKLARSIDEANAESAVELAAFVFMPEHVHLLVYPTPIYRLSMDCRLEQCLEKYGALAEPVAHGERPRRGEWHSF
jgi:putative transposase